MLDNCDYYIELYKDSKEKNKARYESMNPRVVNNLEKLAYLELVEDKPVEAKNHLPTEKYGFTKLGRLIGLSLSWYTDEPSIDLYYEIFYQCIQLYKSMNYSHALFCVIFLKSCFGEKKFHLIINSLINLLENASDDKHEFLNQIKFLETFYRNDLEMLNIYKNSFQELCSRDNSKYQVELYNLKLAIEETHEFKLMYLKDFEVLRYKVKQDINKAVFSAYCNACKNHLVATLDTLEYLELCVKSVISEKGVLDIECPYCKMGYLDFHTLYNRIPSSVEEGGYEENFIKIIFDADNENKFKNKSQRYQHILKFLLSDEHTWFKITDIQDGVLFDVPEIFKVDLNKNPSEIKKNQNPQFNKYLRNLEKWKLVISRPAKGKGGTDTKEYSLSKIGKILATIIDFSLSEEKQSSNSSYDKLFDIWKSYLNDYPSSLDLFCLGYIEMCKKHGSFKELAEFFIEKTIYNKNNQQYIKTFIDLFTQMALVKVADKQTNKTLFDLWRMSFYQLDDVTQKLFVNHLSNYINRISIMKAFDCATFELKRYESRNFDDKIIAEFYCTFCKSDYKYIVLEVLSYLSYIFNQPDEKIQEILYNLKCENCKESKFEMAIVVL